MKISIVVIIMVILIPFSLYSFSYLMEISNSIPFSLNDFKSSVIDARTQGMGGTSILSSRGADFVFNNPSQLSSLTKKNIQISFDGRTGNSEYSYKIQQRVYDIDYPFYCKLNGISIAFPYHPKEFQDLKFGLGMGYRTFYDLSRNSNLKIEDDDYVYKIEEDVSGGYNNLVFAGGFCWKNKLMGGLSVSIPFLSEVEVDGKTKLFPDSRSIEIEYLNKGTINGVFYTFACSYNFNEKLMLGMRIRTGFTQEIDYEIDPEWYSDRDYYLSQKAEYEIPAEYGFSASCKLSENTVFCAEYLYNDLGKYEYDNGYLEGEIFEDSDAGYTVNLGLETGTKTKLRAGYFINSVPIYSNKTSDEDSSKPDSEMGFTIGTGLSLWKNFTLDAFGLYSFMKFDQEMVYSEEENETIDVTHNRFKLGFTIGYNF